MAGRNQPVPAIIALTDQHVPMLISGVRHHQRRIGDDVAPGTLAITGPGVCPLCLSLLPAPFVLNNPTARNLFPAQGDNFLRYGSARVLH
jgi:hypothetical protein